MDGPSSSCPIQGTGAKVRSPLKAQLKHFHILFRNFVTASAGKDMTIQPNKCANGAKGAYFPWVAHLVLVVQVQEHVANPSQGLGRGNRS